MQRCPQTEINHSERQDLRTRVMGGHQNMLVSDGYATHVMKWLMRRIFVLKGIPLFTLYSSLFIVDPFINPILRNHLLFISKKNHLVLPNFQIQHRSRHRSTSLQRVWPSVCIIYMESTHQLHTSPSPTWATAQQEWVCVCACMKRDVPISTLFEAHGLSRNVKGGGRQQREGEGRG